LKGKVWLIRYARQELLKHKRKETKENMKGANVSMYQIGQLVSFKLAKNPDSRTKLGYIHKLHKSGKRGVAEIKPLDGSHKVSRKLVHVASME